MKRGLVRSSRYSPSNMDRESLEKLFVGRQKTMQDVIDRVSHSVESPDKHYILLVGPRGSGKTHFVALAYHRILDRLSAKGLNDKAVIALLNEEEWGVASYLDFLVRILRALANESPHLESRTAEIYNKFSHDPVEAEAMAEALLRKHTEGKTLLLLCENLVDLFQGLGEVGQKRWRAFIQECGFWTIVATTPALFTALSLQKHPFFGFFTIRKLEKIDLSTALELLVRKAVHEDQAELADFLGTPIGRARVRAIHHLAAGNHRAYVVLFDFLDKESLDHLIHPFMQMVDDLTPYYQDRMRQLPPAQRKIVEFLCLSTRPVRIKDISTPCLMSHQTTSKQIGALAATGFVRRIQSGRNTYCEISEPLMRICIEIKDNRTQHFHLFVEFLRHWYSNRELEQRITVLEHDTHSRDLDRVHLKEAVRCHRDDSEEPFINALHAEAVQCLETHDYKGLVCIQETLVQNSGRAEDYHWYMYALLEVGDEPSAITVGQEATKRYSDDDVLYFDLAEAYWVLDQNEEALLAVDCAIALDPNKGDYRCLRVSILNELEHYEDAIKEAEAQLVLNSDHWHSYSQIIEALVGLDRIQEAEVCAQDLIELAPDDPDALVIALEFHYYQSSLRRALDLANTALHIEADNKTVRHIRGLIHFNLGNHRLACEDLRYIISCDPNSISAHCRLSDSLVSLGDFEESLKVSEYLIELDPSHTHAYLVRGMSLIELGHTAEGITAFNDLLGTDDFDSLLEAALWVRKSGDYMSASAYLDRVAELQSGSVELWTQRTQLQIDIGDFDMAMKSAEKVKALADSTIPGWLLMVQAASGKEPLANVLDRLIIVLDVKDLEANEQFYVDALSNALAISMKEFGPQQLNQGMVKIRKLFSISLHTGIVGSILTNFLIDNVNSLSGSLKDWKQTLNSVTDSLADLSDCIIPIEMLTAAVMYTNTGEEKHMLWLPLEQRQLLKEALSQNVRPSDGN